MLTLVAVGAVAGPRVALLIGNDNYADTGARLNNAVNDARGMSEKLQQIGFKVIFRPNATGSGMKEAIREFGKQIEGAEIAFFYYSGHALQFQGSNYLVPIDASLKSDRDLMLDGIDASTITYLMNASGSRNIVVFDACRDNPYRSLFRVGAGLAQMPTPPDTVIAYSAGVNAVAYDGSGPNSTYTKHLLRFVTTPGEEIKRMFTRVAEAVENDTRNAKPPQAPAMLVRLKADDLILVPVVPAVAAPVTVERPAAAVADPSRASVDSQMNAQRVFWESVDKSRSEEIELYVSRYPKGLYIDLATSKLAQLRQATPSVNTVPPAVLAQAAVPPSAPTTIQAAASTVTPTPMPPAKPTPTAAATPTVAATPTAGATPAPAPAANASSTVNAPAAPIPAAAVAAVEPTRLAMADVRLTRDLPKPQIAPNGLRPDKGDVRYADGSVYRGPLRNDLPNGVGEYDGADGVRYSGEFVDGRWEGKGLALWTTGNRYEGSFRNYKSHGRGVLTFASGDVYEGDFVDGDLTGTGRYHFARSNDVYEGEVRNSAFTGKGVFKSGNGEVFEGEFVNGKLNGTGSSRHNSGLVYQGEFRDDVFDGRGTLQLANGMVYVGQFSHGTAKGAGILNFPDGSRFEGDFQNGLMAAKGILQNPQGQRRAAEIVDGQLKAN